MAGEWFSFRRDACATNCCAGFVVWFETGRTATITGIPNGLPGRADGGGSISKVRLYSQLELAVLGFVVIFDILFELVRVGFEWKT